MDFAVGEVFRRKVAVVDETSGVEESIILSVQYLQTNINSLHTTTRSSPKARYKPATPNGFRVAIAFEWQDPLAWKMMSTGHVGECSLQGKEG
ncbi:hypothetical protein P5673_001956 [Acropora cervicornis]|uniref:Uncharacterized protein n=1 Tax=Acropora cervicornis TaxID=6130 RepID=A0AAD9R4J5_ACRCE|nr:hypothetical protein P5673_001956 [Acropora cervicornis]